MRSYLVQRGTFKHHNKDEITGIDSLISWDYMGSAEFEFGALPQSLGRIISSWGKYEAVETPLENKDGIKIMLLCPKDKSQESIQCVIDVSQKKHRTKESVHLQEYLEGKNKKDSYYRANFWWDIENDWMACPGKEKMDLVKLAIEKVIEKRKSA